MSAKPTSFYIAVWAWVRKIPKGRVASYGQIATALGSPRAARAVGYAMFALIEAPRDKPVPWHRVLNAKGEISIGGALHRPDLQRKLLESEGVDFDAAGRVDLQRYRYTPKAKARYHIDKRYL
jgi:methylated-DNA-protein-cysteine methyltransferase-like protein